MKTLVLLTVLLMPALAVAAIHKEAVAYKDGDAELMGYLYWDDAATGPRPGVMVVHEWWGLNDYAERRARMLAEQGYVAFAADMYGVGKVTRHAEDASGWVKQILANQDAWRQRALAGLAQLRNNPRVDGERLAAIGYCFGGATVMQMAYAGADLDLVGSFHGSLPLPSEQEAADIKARVYVAHGGSDPFVPGERVAAFSKALSDAKVDWEMDVFGRAQHGFTNPEAATYGMDNVAYEARADQHSWSRLLAALEEVFAGK